MGWQQRRRKQFYYRSTRINGRVHAVYLGNGETAERVAAEVASAKAKRMADQTALADFQARLANVDQLAADVDQGVRLLTEAVLLTAGFREHRGQWRLRRD
jgi:hypothetical protein